MPNEQKKQEVGELRELISRAEAMILADYRGLTVAEMEELRNKMREQGLQFRVVKNRLMKIALQEEESGVDVDEQLRGPTGVAFGFDDPVSLAKTVLGFAGSHEVFSPKCGILGESVLDAEQVKSLSKMPGLNEMRGQLASSMMQPMREVAVMMTEPARELATAMDQLLKQLLYAVQARAAQLEG